MAATTLARPFGRYDWVEIERTDGTVAAGFVVYDRNGTVKIHSEHNLVPRWISRGDIAAVLVHVPNPGRQS